MGADGHEEPAFIVLDKTGHRCGGIEIEMEAALFTQDGTVCADSYAFGTAAGAKPKGLPRACMFLFISHGYSFHTKSLSKGDPLKDDFFEFVTYGLTEKVYHAR